MTDVCAVQVYTGAGIYDTEAKPGKRDAPMEQIFDFIFNTREGVAVLFFSGLVIFGLAAFVLEKRTNKLYVDRGPKKDDEDSWF